ncbi:MAG: HAD-IA family hydrolase [Pseudomonadota bacterium]
MSRFEAIVFDLDGTLVETAPDLQAILADVLAEIDLQAPSVDTTRPLIGRGARRLVEASLEHADHPIDPLLLDRLHRRFMEIYNAKPCRLSTPYDGVADVLEVFAGEGRLMGVCTNKPQKPSDALLEALDLARYFGSIIGADALPVRKPDPAHLLAVIDALGASRESAVMIGDSATDLNTARALGVPCVLVSFGYTEISAHELGSDRVIDHFSMLPQTLATL